MARDAAASLAGAAVGSAGGFCVEAMSRSFLITEQGRSVQKFVSKNFKIDVNSFYHKMN
jgi:hypothetical protein